MQEKNRHILIDGIMKLPEHKAPAGLWNNIEPMIFSVPADILPVHKPSEATWSAIEAGIVRGTIFEKTVYRYIAIALLVFLIGGVAITYFDSNYFTFLPTPEKSNFGIVTTNEQENSNQKDKLFNNEKSIDVIEDISSKVPVEAGESNNFQFENQVEKKSVDKNNTYETTLQFNDDINITALKTIEIGFITNHQNKSKSDLSLNNLPPNQDDNSAIKKDPFQDCNFQQPEQSFYVGPGFEYQHFMNSIEPDNAKMKYWYTADFRIQFKRNRFFIETGIGISFSKDNIDFTYDYLTNELISTYEYVDSVHYDPVTGTTEYYTTTVEVYDSIPYSTQSSLETSYTYLQIPLEIGYEVWKVKKFSLSIKAGITYFKELTAKEIQPNLFHENSRITSINTSNISRNKELFRISGGIGFNWDMNKKINIILSPSFNYFLVNIYDNVDITQNPIGLGIRFGLYYKF